MKNDRILWLSFAIANLIIHIIFNNNIGFHRDEFLYMALGRHLDFGYWSNAPLIGVIARLNETIFGSSLVGMRMFSGLAAATLVYLAGWMAKLMGGNRFAQVLACLSMFFSLAWMRSGMFLMPVVFDTLLWTLCLFFVLNYLVTDDRKQITWFGLTCGILMLNKYSLPFLLLPLLAAALFSPQRKIFTYKETYLGLGLGLLAWAPNLTWQMLNDFPVITHMRMLSENQLVNVSAKDFLMDQLMMNFSVTPVWIAGLVFLFLKKEKGHLRILAWGYAGMLALLLILQGKSYYTLGYYPLLYSAGSVLWERILKPAWARVLLCCFIIGLSLMFLPAAVPVMKVDRLVNYFSWVTAKIPVMKNLTRWEDGQYYPLPQDYADMLGWEELADLAGEAYQKVKDKSRVMIYCENYGQAGAVEHFGKKYKLPPVQSFSDSYLFWAQEEIPDSLDHLIYINDELGEDVQSLFAEIKSIGKVSHPLARENGTTVYLCSKPRSLLKQFWKSRVQEARAAWRLEE